MIASSTDWVIELAALLVRAPAAYSHDVAGMTSTERWGLYKHLQRLESEARLEAPR